MEMTDPRSRPDWCGYSSPEQKLADVTTEARGLLRTLDERRVSLYGAADAFRDQAERLRRAFGDPSPGGPDA